MSIAGLVTGKPVSPGRVPLVGRHSIDIRDYVIGGVEKTNDPTRDDTAAFQQAVTDARAYGDGTRRPNIFIAPGYYYVHEVSLPGHVTFTGEHTFYNQVISYNGDGGAGSCLFQMDVVNPGTSAAAGGMFRNLDLVGYDGTTTGHVAESILAWGSGSTIGLDWGVVWEWTRMACCFGDAIKFVAGQNSALVNLHTGPMRFDQCGGYALSLDCTGAGNMSQRMIDFMQLTMDSRLPNGNFSTAAQADGVWNGTAGWGKGLLLAKECAGTTFRIGGGRFEVNGAMASVSGVRSLVRVDNSQTNSTKIRFEDALVAPRSADAMVAVHDIGTTLSDVSWVGFDGDSRTKIYQSTTDSPANDVATNGMVGAFGAVGVPSGQQGIVLGGRRIEFRSATPGITVNVDYRAGDLILNSSPGASADGWVCYSPTTGFSNPQTATQASSATWGTANGVVTPASANSLRVFPVGMNVILVGGGAAAADLNCRVTAIDPDAGTFTVNTTPGTAKAGNGSIKFQNPVWRQLGVSRQDLSLVGQALKGESFDRGTSTSSLLLVSDTAYFSAVGLKAGDVVTNVVFGLETAGTQGASGAFYVGLYNSSGTRLAISADATASAVGATGPITVALSSAYTVTADGLYYLMAYSNFATTQPSLLRGSAGGTAASAVSGGARKYARQVGAGGTPPTSATLANGSVHIWLAWS